MFLCSQCLAFRGVKMNSQQRTFSWTSLVFFTSIVTILLLPIIAGRNLKSSKSEQGDNDILGPSFTNSKSNDQYNTASSPSYYTAKHNLRSLLMEAKDYHPKLYSRTPLSLDLMDFLLEYEDEDRSKRFDDYGHMRFGKRGGEEQFDDYGHMRFGRSG